MRKEDTLRCLTAYLAAQEAPVREFPSLVAAARRDNLVVELETALKHLDALPLLRRLRRAEEQGTALRWDEVVQHDEEVWWRNSIIGKLLYLHTRRYPQETQARIAYEVMEDRYLSHAQRRTGAVVLHQNRAGTLLFMPEGKPLDLEQCWRDFVDNTFSEDGLRQLFAVLVNSVRLSDRGVSTLNFPPIVNKQHARYVAAFYRANLFRTEQYTRRREAAITENTRHLAETNNPKEQHKLAREVVRLRGEIDMHTQKYRTAFDVLARLQQEHSGWMRAVETLARREFSGEAGHQLGQKRDILTKAANEMRALATMQADQFFKLDPLFSVTPQIPTMRPGGDDSPLVCYVCGEALGRGAAKHKANKFIFESPSQRVQSGSSQKEPRVCAACTLVSFASPIKIGIGRLVIKLRPRTSPDTPKAAYLLQEQLRMLVMGEMNVVAGRYVMLRASEQVQKRGGYASLASVLGGRQYAFYKVASLFGDEVFREYEVEAVVGDAELLLPPRHLSALRGFIEAFSLDSRRWWEDPTLLAAMGQVIRYVEREALTAAIYEMVKAWRGKGFAFSVVQASRLEQLRESYGRWLMQDPKQQERAQVYCDVAAMTGMLYAFCNFVRKEVAADPKGNPRVEVRKLIERTLEPFGFIYTAAGDTKREQATLFYSSDLYFSFEQSRKLLEALGINVAEREGSTEKGVPYLTFYFDDVVSAYHYLLQQLRYGSAVAMRDFLYILRLSLHARFPEFIESSKEGDL